MVDDDVVRVDAALCKLLDEALRLIQREELGDTNTDKGGLFLMETRKGQKKIRVYRKLLILGARLL